MPWNPPKHPSRKEHRLGLTETTEFETMDGRTFGCKIVNYSENGMCISAGVQLDPGQVIKLTSPTCYARVMWCRESKVGLKFLSNRRITAK